MAHKTEAEQLLAKPTQELKDAIANAPEQSAASDSEYRQNFRFEDGSIVVVHSFRGGPANHWAFTNAEAIPINLIELTDTAQG